MTIRPLSAADLPLADALLRAALGGRMQARRGELVDVLEGAGGLLAVDAAGAAVGIATWLVSNDVAEVRAVAVVEAMRSHGVGRRLMDAVGAALLNAGVHRAWLITTNDNLAALALYQKTGWRLAALRPGAVDELRRTLKPSIPQIGEHGIPLRDELELELPLDRRADPT